MRGVCIVLLFIAACGSSQRGSSTEIEHTATGAIVPNPGWAYVPADTAFVIATEASFDRLPWFGTDPAYVDLGERVHELEVQGVLARKQLPEWTGKTLRAIELIGHDYQIAAQDLEKAGIGASSRGLAYEVGGNLVGRIEIANREVFEPQLLALLEIADLPLVEKQYKGEVYWEYSFGQILAVLSLRKNELVGAIVWNGELQTTLMSLFTLNPSPIDHQTMRAEFRTRLAVGDYLGYVDTGYAAKLFVRAVQYFSESTKGGKAKGSNEGCEREVPALAAGLPRIWFSGTRTAEGSENGMYLDLAPELLPGLKRMSHPVPRVSLLGKTVPFASVSVGVDVGRLLQSTQSLLYSLSKTKYQCEYLQSMASEAGKLSKTLKSVIFSPLARLKGMAGTIESRELDEHGNLTLKALMALGHESPNNIFNLMRLLPDTKLPDSLERGAMPKRFYSKSVATLGATEIAIGESSIGISVGMGRELREVLASEPVDGPLFSMVLSAEALDAARDEEVEVEGVFDPHLATAITAITSGAVLKNSWVSIEVRPAERGVHFTSKTGRAK